MIQITNISDDYDQLINLTLDDGSTLNLELKYRSNVQQWFVSISYGTFLVYNILVCLSANFLRSFRNQIPFGMACLNLTSVDPLDVEDFVNGNATLYLLNAADVVSVEGIVYS